MNSRELIQGLNTEIPESLQDSWDNSGLQIESIEKDIKKIYIAMDLTDEVTKAAIENNADMIITHHPLIFSPLKTIKKDNFITKRVIDLIKNDIIYYAMHTNFDKAFMGEIAAERLGLNIEENLEDTDEFNNKLLGYGKVGKLDADYTAAQISDRIKEKFDIPKVKVFGDKNEKVSKIAIMPGSGKSFINNALKKQVDMLITGDIDHHTGIDANAQNLIIIDAGHYGIEHIFVEFMKTYINEKFPEVEVITESVKVPFEVM